MGAVCATGFAKAGVPSGFVDALKGGEGNPSDSIPTILEPMEARFCALPPSRKAARQIFTLSVGNKVIQAAIKKAIPIKKNSIP